MNRRTYCAITLACLSLFLLAGCFDADFFIGGSPSCFLPNTPIADSQLIGTWQAVYEDYNAAAFPESDPSNSDYVSGMDTIVLRADGSYSQRFVGEDGTTIERMGTWRRIDNEEDGIKLELSGLAYVANGLHTVDEPLRLRAQRFDLLRYQELRGLLPPDPDTRLSVNYPADGYVFLYPRVCYGDPALVLVQMAVGRGDPDARGRQNPPFMRVAGEAVVSLHNGEEVASVIGTEMTFVTAENIDEFLTQ